MNTIPAAQRVPGATFLVALLAIAASAPSARADYLVRTFIDGAPAAYRPPPFAPAEPLTADRPFEEPGEPPEPEIDEEMLATVQALLVFAIPPPVNTIIQTQTPAPTPTQTTQPGVPVPPPYSAAVAPVYDITIASITPEDAPEPSSLVIALVGSGMTGLLMLRRRSKENLRLAFG